MKNVVMVAKNDTGFTPELNLLSSQVCAVPLGPVQRQRSLRPDQIQEAVPVRRNRGRGDKTSESVRDLRRFEIFKISILNILGQSVVPF